MKDEILAAEQEAASLVQGLPTDEELNEMSEEEFARVVNGIPRLSNNDMRRYMRLMSNNKPVNEEAKAKAKQKARAKAKLQKKSRKANRK